MNNFWKLDPMCPDKMGEVVGKLHEWKAPRKLDPGMYQGTQVYAYFEAKMGEIGVKG